MGQMITRLDDELHARIKERAAIEGRSVNEFVVRALTQVLDSTSARRAFRERLRAMGRLVEPEPPARTPTWEEIDALTKDAGTSVSEELEAQRSARW
jgi:plasmid stability protein